jgi:cytochrome c nitrite reductase small subunit
MMPLLMLSLVAALPAQESASCAKCHVMSQHFDTWSASGHAKVAGCADCHLPQAGLARKLFFTGKDGLKHAAMTALRAEPESLRISGGGAAVLQENCLRCHGYFTDGTIRNISSASLSDDRKKAMSATAYHADTSRSCVECHRETAHQGSGRTSAPVMRTAYSGTSLSPRLQTVRTFSIFRTASIPSTTRPKTQ